MPRPAHVGFASMRKCGPMTTTMEIPARFNGPAHSGNGGFVSGALAETVPGSAGGHVEVTLRLPPPLDTRMEVTVTDDRTVLSDGDRVVAEAHLVDVDLEPVDAVPP